MFIHECVSFTVAIPLKYYKRKLGSKPEFLVLDNVPIWKLEIFISLMLHHKYQNTVYEN